MFEMWNCLFSFVNKTFYNSVIDIAFTQIFFD